MIRFLKAFLLLLFLPVITILGATAVFLIMLICVPVVCIQEIFEKEEVDRNIYD